MKSIHVSSPLVTIEKLSHNFILLALFLNNVRRVLFEIGLSNHLEFFFLPNSNFLPKHPYSLAVFTKSSSFERSSFEAFMNRVFSPLILSFLYFELLSQGLCN